MLRESQRRQMRTQSVLWRPMRGDESMRWTVSERQNEGVGGLSVEMRQQETLMMLLKVVTPSHSTALVGRREIWWLSSTTSEVPPSWSERHPSKQEMKRMVEIKGNYLKNWIFSVCLGFKREVRTLENVSTDVDKNCGPKTKPCVSEGAGRIWRKIQ